MLIYIKSYIIYSYFYLIGNTCFIYAICDFWPKLMIISALND